MTREEMIQLLVLDRIEYGSDCQRYTWLQNVLEFGFGGFANMSEPELMVEMDALSSRPTMDAAMIDPDHHDGDDFDDDMTHLISSYAHAQDYRTD